MLKRPRREGLNHSGHDTNDKRLVGQAISGRIRRRAPVLTRQPVSDPAEPRLSWRGCVYPGQHEAIVDADLWSLVQEKLAANGFAHSLAATATVPSLLSGLIFDGDGQRMTLADANKNGMGAGAASTLAATAHRSLDVTWTECGPV